MTLICRPPGATKEADLTWLDFSEAHGLSDDGRSVLIGEAGIAGGGAGAIYLRNTDGGEAVRLGSGLPAMLSRDGKWALAYTADSTQRWSVVPTGAGAPQAIDVGDGKIVSAEFFPDSRSLLQLIARPGQNNRLYRSRVDLATGHRTPLRQLGPQFVDGVDGLSSLVLSADGASYCYSYKRDISDLYVVSGLQ
jgi:eukaryotic-like serine/threonine-protein kinase